MREPNESVILRRWPEIIPVLARHGLMAEFIAAVDSDAVDTIEVRRLGAETGDDLGDIIFAEGGWFYASTWMNAERQTRRTGEDFRTVESACGELVEMLKEDGFL